MRKIVLSALALTLAVAALALVATPAEAKPAYCDCALCAEVSRYATCTDPWSKEVFNYLDWCWYRCVFFTSAADTELEPALLPEDGEVQLQDGQTPKPEADLPAVPLEDPEARPLTPAPACGGATLYSSPW